MTSAQRHPPRHRLHDLDRGCRPASSTGISAADRARTVQAAVARDAEGQRPGAARPHLPACKRAGRRRPDASRPHRSRLRPRRRWPGLTPGGGHLRGDERRRHDGAPARSHASSPQEHNLKIGTIAGLIEHRSRHEIADRAHGRSARLTTAQGTFDCIAFSDRSRRPAPRAHAWVAGRAADEVLVRVHEPLSVMDLLDADDRRPALVAPA